MRIWLYTLTCLLIGLNALPAAARLRDRAPGDLFLTRAEIEDARRRCASDPAAAATQAKLLQQADALVAERLDIPQRGGQWAHWYSCPKDAGNLETLSPTQHRCPICGAVYSGWPYDDAYIAKRHGHWIGGVETLGWAYALAPKAVYAERVREILLAYAAFYSRLPLHDRDNKLSESAARLSAQTLNEAVWLCNLALGYDRVRGAACFARADRAAIAKGLLRPMTEVILRNDAKESNWQSWHNAALACAGYLLNDRTLVDTAIRGKHGFRFQLDRSLTPSGIWYEGSISYHWYAMQAHLYLLEAAAHNGEMLYADPRVRKLFSGPLQMLYPDDTWPALNDSTRIRIASTSRFYAVAWKRYEDPQFGAFAGAPDGPIALFWGRPAPAQKAALHLGSVPDASNGVAVLRDAANGVCVMLDYGTARSGHVQPEKLGINLYACQGERLALPGSAPYSTKLYLEWNRHTLAHNAPVVNARSQKRSEGALVDFQAAGSAQQLDAALRAMLPPGYDTAPLLKPLDAQRPVAFASARADRAYREAKMQRLIALQFPNVVDVTRVQADDIATVDLPMHWRGAIEKLDGLAPAEPLGDKDGYGWLKEVQRAADPDAQFEVKPKAGGRIEVRVPGGDVLYYAGSFGKNAKETLPTIIRRERGRDVVFVSVYTIGNGPPASTPETE